MHTKIRLSLIEQGRAAEWLTSSVLLSFAVFLAFPGDTLSSTNGYVGFRNLSFDEASLATPLALISASRMAALYINGNWRRSPVVPSVRRYGRHRGFLSSRRHLRLAVALGGRAFQTR